MWHQPNPHRPQNRRQPRQSRTHLARRRCLRLLVLLGVLRFGARRALAVGFAFGFAVGLGFAFAAHPEHVVVAIVVIVVVVVVVVAYATGARLRSSDGMPHYGY
jgi:uncharacterized protein (DUF2062 family)